MHRRVREILSFQGKATAALARNILFARGAIQEVATVELHTRHISIYGKCNAAFFRNSKGSLSQAILYRATENPVVIIAGTPDKLMEVIVNSFSNRSQLTEVHRSSLGLIDFAVWQSLSIGFSKAICHNLQLVVENGTAADAI